MTRLMPLITLFALTTAVLALSLLWRLLAAKSGETGQNPRFPEAASKSFIDRIEGDIDRGFERLARKKEDNASKRLRREDS